MSGHPTTTAAEAHPEMLADFCGRCGEPTIKECPHCQKAIRGRHVEPDVFDFTKYHVPAFCHACGKAYPWTATAIEAAATLVRESGALDPAEADKVEASMIAVVRDTPTAIVEAGRLKKNLAKAGKVTADAVRDLLVDLVSETIKKTMWGP